MRIRLIDPERSSRAWLWLLALALILLAGNARIGLWDQDEAAYAGFGRHMVESGDWLVPEYTWSKHHRKPPLHFWGIAASQSILGQHVWATRLPGALAIWLCSWLLWRQGSLLYGKETGRWAAMILGTSGISQLLGHMSLTDSTLLLFETFTALSLIRTVNGLKSYIWTFWLTIGLGVLTKGPPIIIFAGAMGLLLMIFHPYRKYLFKPRFWYGLPLAIIPILTWGYFAWQRDDGVFISWLVDWYILRRVKGSVFGQSGPPGYHLVVMLLAFLPWLFILPFTIKKAWKGAKKRKAQIIGLLAWLAAGWIPYELVSSKLPTYALAAHPALALLFAYFLSRWKPEGKIGVFFVQNKVAWLAGVCIFWAIIWGLIIPTFSHTKDSSIALKTAIEQHAEHTTPLLIGQHKAKPPSLPFYLEKDFPLTFETTSQKMARWKKSHPSGLLILDNEQINDLSQLIDIQVIDSVLHRNSGKNVIIEYFICE